MRLPSILVLAVSTAWAAQATEVEVRIRLTGPEAAPAAQAQGVLVLDPLLDETRAARRTLPAHLPGETALHLPRGSRWRLHAELPGYWTPTTAVLADAEHRLELAFQPTAETRGRIVAAPGEELPSHLEVSFAPPGGSRQRQPAGSVVCPLERDRSLSCRLPVGVLDLRLYHPGFAAVYRWEVPVREGLDLGEIPLLPGASLVGSVGVEGGRLEGVALSVRAAPLMGSPAGGRARARLERLTLSTAPDARGFFQLQDLPEGAYEVSVHGDGWAEARRSPVRIYQGRETDLGELLLRRPVPWELLLTPPVAPSGAAWTLRLRSRRTSGDDLEIEGRAGFDGAWQVEELPPGGYDLVVADGPGSVWHRGPVEVDPGTGPLLMELSVVRVRGRVERRGEPARARLTFDRPGGHAVLFSDPGGVFAGALPGAGEWPVSVLLRRDGAEQHLEPVQIDTDGGEAWLEIEIPDTRLRGRVVDRGGRPVADTLVLATLEEGGLRSSRMRTDREGEFLFEGLPPGPWALDALSPEGRSGRTVIDLEAGEEARVRLVMEEPKRVRGRVVSPRGPVLGASVHLYPELPSYRRVPVQHRLTGPGGGFVVAVPPDTESLRIVVLAPGFGARILRAPMPEDTAEITLPVAEPGGTLVLDPPGTASAPDPQSTLTKDGVPIWLSLLAPWVALHAQQQEAGCWRLPSMEVGEYRFCTPDGQACAGGFLAPGGELRLRPVAGAEPGGLAD